MTRYLIILTVVVAGASSAAAQARTDATSGSLCVLPHVKRARARTQSPEVPPAAEHYSLRLDGGAWVPLSAQTAVLLADIPLTGTHRIAIRGDGRPFSAFSFSFSSRHDLCLSQSGLYLTWRFHPSPDYAGCQCRGIAPVRWTAGRRGNPS